MKYFHHLSLVPYIDIALMDNYTLQNNQVFVNKAVLFDCDSEILKNKLATSKIIYIHPNVIDVWKPKLFEIEFDPKLFIFFGSDIFIDNEIQEFGNRFPNAKFWIQNYTGVESGPYTILPIGVNCDYTNEITKSQILGISHVTDTGGFRKEFIRFLNATPLLHKDCLQKASMDIYLENLSKCYFSVCPMGNGFDTLRFWESLMVKAIPVVLAHDYYENLRFQYNKLPFIVLNSWDQLETYNFSIELYNFLWSDSTIIYENYWTKNL